MYNTDVYLTYTTVCYVEQNVNTCAITNIILPIQNVGQVMNNNQNQK